VTKPFAQEPLGAMTTLMLLEIWLTTQAWESLKGLTETGPNPTGIWANKLGLPGWVTSNTDNDEFALFTANKNLPSLERRIGLVCAGSKFAYAGDPDCALRAIGCASASTNTAAPVSVRQAGDIIFPSFEDSEQVTQELRRRRSRSRVYAHDAQRVASQNQGL